MKIFSEFLLTLEGAYDKNGTIMSRLIKNSRGYLGLGIFLVGLLAIVVVSYARQVKQSDSQMGVLRPLAQENRNRISG